MYELKKNSDQIIQQGSFYKNNFIMIILYELSFKNHILLESFLRRLFYVIMLYAKFAFERRARASCPFKSPSNV